MTDFITISVYPSRMEAEIVKGLLESEGIQAVITGDDSDGINPYPMLQSSGIELKVPKKGEEKAKIILRSLDNKNRPV